MECAECEMTTPEHWITLAEVADYLQISRAKIYAMAQLKEIPCTKVGGQWRFNRDEIDPWMHAQRMASTQPVGSSGKSGKPRGGRR